MKLRELFRRKQAIGETKTKGYQPLATSEWALQRNLPPFGFDTIRFMLVDETVRISLAMRAAPLSGVKWGYKEGETWVEGVRSPNPEVSAFVARQLQRIWRNHLGSLVKAQIWGWSAGEVTLKLTPENMVEVDRLEARHAMDCRVIVGGGKKRGVEVSRIKNVGKVDLDFPRAWFHAHDPDDGQEYGRSVLIGAYSPWADKCMFGGARDVRRLFMHKDAYGGMDLSYPEGSEWDENGVEIPNRDIARQIVEQITAGGVTTRPSTRDDNGNEKWQLTRATVPGNPQHILQYPRDLDGEIRSGILIPDGVIDDDGASGAWAGKRIPLAAFYSSLDQWVQSIGSDFTEQVFEPLVKLNFGSAIDFEVAHKPLAEQAMEQQSTAGGGQPEVGGAQPPVQPQRMSLDAVDAVGRGVLGAGRIVEAARSVLRMSSEDRSKGFWRSGDDGEKIFIGPDGEARAGGPSGKTLSPKSDPREPAKAPQKPKAKAEKSDPREPAKAPVKAKEPLSKQEAAAITTYSTRKFQEINTDLRAGKMSRNAATIRNLDSALEKSRTIEDQQLFRSGHVPGLDEALKSGKVEGLEFSDDAYTSTSKDKAIAENFARGDARRIKINVPKGSSALDVGDNAGGLKGEQEVLLPRGSKFKVKGIQKVKEKVSYRDLKGKTKHRMATVEYVEVDLVNEDGE